MARKPRSIVVVYPKIRCIHSACPSTFHPMIMFTAKMVLFAMISSDPLLATGPTAPSVRGSMSTSWAPPLTLVLFMDRRKPWQIDCVATRMECWRFGIDLHMKDWSHCCPKRTIIPIWNAFANHVTCFASLLVTLVSMNKFTWPSFTPSTCANTIAWPWSWADWIHIGTTRRYTKRLDTLLPPWCSIFSWESGCHSWLDPKRLSEAISPFRLLATGMATTRRHTPPLRRLSQRPPSVWDTPLFRYLINSTTGYNMWSLIDSSI